MAKIVTDNTAALVTPITRKQLASLLREATAIASIPGLGAAMEYWLTMLDGSRTVVVAKADGDHDLVSARIGELARNR